MEYTLGGNRVGSGKKMRGNMRNYFRSTHDLSEKFISSMGSGILYPCLCKLATRGDSFEIGLNADCRTIPTRGPLFGRYKLQVDLYQVPVRLYQGLLHNNPLAIGLQMNKVFFPTIHVGGTYTHGTERGVKMNESSLLKYLGLSGLGQKQNAENGPAYIYRNINAVPVLAYYDIFKNYYANKQEEKAYVISGSTPTAGYGELKEIVWLNSVNNKIIEPNVYYDTVIHKTDTVLTFKVVGKWLHLYNIVIEVIGDIQEIQTLEQLIMGEEAEILEQNEDSITFKVLAGDWLGDPDTLTNIQFKISLDRNTPVNQNSHVQIVPFDLSNIDDMRYDMLSNNKLNTHYVIGGTGATGHVAYLPYSVLTENYTDLNNDPRTYNELPLNGLVLKTYQNDIYNNWLNTEFIEGDNGINELTKITVDDNGAFSMDALNFAQKLYNMLNRIAVAGATYEDWQDAVYEEVKRRQIESPIFCGGLSQEVVFDEIVQTAPAGEGVLGTLGGRGRLAEHTRKGGKIHIKCDEACFIIGIASLTPREVYTQGNEFYMTDIYSMDDIHKPAMDGIGFQDLIGERMAWWDTKINMQAGVAVGAERTKIGKLPAWIEYMTSVDKAYGDFAQEYGVGYMVLNRNYEYDTETGGIKDATTYIDPAKYNYAFAYADLTAQNFWVEIAFDIKARRLMSARLIPNV